MVLPQTFYSSADVVELSKKLLGKKLCSTLGGEYTSGLIVETEAYRGFDDKACHAYGGKKTPRALTMYKEPGLAYVYLCYGIHPLFNIVTGIDGEAEVVLIRAIEPVDGIQAMTERRNQTKITNLGSGPGKLTQALGIKKASNELRLFDDHAELWLEDGIELSEDEIIAGPRVGLSTAEECMNWEWRFRIKGNTFASKPNKVFYEGYPSTL